MTDSYDPGLVAGPFIMPEANVDEAHGSVPAFNYARPKPGRGVFFDPDLDLREPEATRLTDWLVDQFDKVRRMKRLRDRAVWRLRLRKVAANAMRGHFYRNPPAVLYRRGAAPDDGEEQPSWMKHGALADVVDALVAAGLLEGIHGKRMPPKSKSKSYMSSFWPTPALVEQAISFGLSPTSIKSSVRREDLVRLFAPKLRAEFDVIRREMTQPRKGARINCALLPEWPAMTERLAAINQHYRQQSIDIGHTDQERLAWVNDLNCNPETVGLAYRLPEMFSTDLYRVFNNGDPQNPAFVQGGRLFGGWWMYVPEDLRTAITINGAPTVEMDYANCHPRMLYHQRGLAGDGDLYAVPEITTYEMATGVGIGTYRRWVKWLMQILLNGRGRPDLVEPPEWLAVPPDISAIEAVGYLRAMHAPIADAFGTVVGLELMRLESEIALDIIEGAMAAGWTALPIHDSFIAEAHQRDHLRALMTESYVRRVGREPSIKE